MIGTRARGTLIAAAPFDKIKIDRSFMQGIEASGRDAEEVMKSIIALGRELDMQVTVEGVETAERVAFLDGANADQVQGYFFGRPMPASEISALILKNFQTTLPIRPRDHLHKTGRRPHKQTAER
jgi:EAL domain-containing protein (putative c-di-GMP-specific phosphodiesterase class I)